MEFEFELEFELELDVEEGSPATMTTLIQDESGDELDRMGRIGISKTHSYSQQEVDSSSDLDH